MEFNVILIEFCSPLTGDRLLTVSLFMIHERWTAKQRHDTPSVNGSSDTLK